VKNLSCRGGVLTWLSRALAVAALSPMAPGLASSQDAATRTGPGSVAASAAAPAPTTQPNDALRLAESWLEAQVAFERLPSLSVAVVLDGQLAWRRAWGHADHAGRIPARPDTAYSICSISKLFTTVAALHLWEQGRLSLDDDIGKLLPAFAVQRSDPESGPITVRTLLTHASRAKRASPTGRRPISPSRHAPNCCKTWPRNTPSSARTSVTSTATWAWPCWARWLPWPPASPMPTSCRPTCWRP
jgi:CubicO group peptidase (beta-lactamase class C family)